MTSDPAIDSAALQNASVLPTADSPSVRSTKKRAWGRSESLQAPLDAAILVPLEKVEVDDFLAARHQSHVDRLLAHGANWPKRELDHLASDEVGGVDLASLVVRGRTDSREGLSVRRHHNPVKDLAPVRRTPNCS